MPKFYPFFVQTLFAKLTTLHIKEGNSVQRSQEAAFSATDLTQSICDTKRFQSQISVLFKIYLGDWLFLFEWLAPELMNVTKALSDRMEQIDARHHLQSPQSMK